MSGALITLTDAGRAALVNPDNTGTISRQVAQIGVATASFVPSNNLVALPNELKRLNTFAGENIAPDTVHVTIRDDSADQYTMYGIGLYLDNGVLLGTYSQATPIMEKSPVAFLLLAADMQFSTIDAAALTFGDTQFINPPATETMQGIIEIATQAETDAGADDTRAITPKKLAARTATETRPGILEIATQAETNAGIDDARAITPKKMAVAVANAIANLVNASPATLDTLSELAASLGNDPNFATTMVNALAGKANLSGATFTGSISAPAINAKGRTTYGVAGVSGQYALFFWPEVAGASAFWIRNKGDNALTIGRGGDPYAGTDAIVITNAGNVGVNRTPVGMNLEVEGRIGAWSGNYYTGVRNTGLLAMIESSNWSNGTGLPLAFNVGAGEVARLDSRNFGLGITPGAWHSTYRAIQFGAGASVHGLSTAVDLAALSSNVVFDSAASLWKHIGAGSAAQYFQSNGAHVWRTATGGAAGGNATWAELARLSANGNFGVGTNVPSSLFQMKGSAPILRITDTTTTSYALATPRIQFGNAVVENIATLGYESTTDEVFSINATGAGSAVKVLVAGSEVARFKPGKFAIGTTNPTYAFVVANDGANGFEVDPSAGGGAQTNILAYDRSANAYRSLNILANSVSLSVGGSLGKNLLLDANGRVLIGSATNDEANKLNIVDSTSFGLGIYRDVDVTVSGSAGEAFSLGARSGATQTTAARIVGTLENPGTTGHLDFQTRTAGALLTRARIDSNGNFLVGTTVHDGTSKLQVSGYISATTPSTADNSTKVATTEHVANKIAALINSAPGALDTLNELAAALGDDPNFATTVANALATKAPLASPGLTGTPTAPTAAAGNNTTQLATTAFIQAALNALGTHSLFSASRANPGYQKLPGGLMMQWGTNANLGINTSTSRTFPVAFPNECFHVFITNAGAGAWATNSTWNITTTGYTEGTGNNNTTGGSHWFAIGY